MILGDLKLDGLNFDLKIYNLMRAVKEKGRSLTTQTQTSVRIKALNDHNTIKKRNIKKIFRYIQYTLR
jgi:hypothetical protein